MKAIQIDRYHRSAALHLREVAVPTFAPDEVLVKVQAAAVNPVDDMIRSGQLRLLMQHRMPLTLGCEFAGVVVAAGQDVLDLTPGLPVYGLLPWTQLGAWADYVVVRAKDVAPIAEGLTMHQAAALPLALLTAYQCLKEELHATAGQKVLITGASGSFGRVAVPLAKAMGLEVYVTGNARSREELLALGAAAYADYRQENYAQLGWHVDHVIDSVGSTTEIERAFSVLKRGGRLASLRGLPNKAFAKAQGLGVMKTLLMTLAGARLDRLAARQGKTYHFHFVRADGAQLRELTKAWSQHPIYPALHRERFTLSRATDALHEMQKAPLTGKVLLVTDA